MRLDGMKALITGASSGVGLGCAVALAEAGSHVVFVSTKHWMGLMMLLMQFNQKG